VARFICPKCGSNRLAKYASRYYGPHARVCKKCGAFGRGSEFAEAARKLNAEQPQTVS